MARIGLNNPIQTVRQSVERLAFPLVKGHSLHLGERLYAPEVENLSFF